MTREQIEKIQDTCWWTPPQVTDIKTLCDMALSSLQEDKMLARLNEIIKQHGLDSAPSAAPQERKHPSRNWSGTGTNPADAAPDLVARLRKAWPDPGGLRSEAADEIERLRGERDALLAASTATKEDK